MKYNTFVSKQTGFSSFGKIEIQASIYGYHQRLEFCNSENFRRPSHLVIIVTTNFLYTASIVANIYIQYIQYIIQEIDCNNCFTVNIRALLCGDLVNI